MPAPALREGRCPRCGKRFRYATVSAHKPFPFCSPRCRDIDLGNWFTGAYAISSAAETKPEEDGAAEQAPETPDGTD